MLPLERLLFSHWAIEGLRILFVISLFAALWSLGRFTTRLFPAIRVAGPGGRLVEIAAGFAVYSALVRTLGFFGLATREAVFAILLLCLVLLWRERASLTAAFVIPDGFGLRRWALAAVSLVPLPMALAPAVSHDALVYQLRFPEMTLWSGTWAVDPTNSTSFFPAATGTLYLAALSMDASGVAAQLVHYGFFLLTLAALVGLGRRLSGGPAAGEWAAMLFASIPAAGVVAGWSWSDMPLCFALLAAGLALTEGRVAAVLLAAGLAASTKYSGLALGLPLAAAAVWVGMRRREIRRLAAGAAAGLLVTLPWYASNWSLTGNPVYPFLPRLFGGSSETAKRILDWSAAGGGGGGGGGWLGYVFRPESVDADVGGVGILILFAAAALYELFAAKRRAAVLLVLSGLVLLFAFAPAARILLPPIAGMSLLAGLAIEDWSQGRRIRAAVVAVVSILVLRGALLAAAHNALFFNPLPAAAGIEGEDAYRLRNRPAAALYDRADKTLPDGARVLVFGESQMFGFPRPALASAIVDPPAAVRFLRGAADPSEVLRRLRSAGISHLLVSLEALHPAIGKEDADWRRGLTPAELALFERVLQASRPVDRQGPLILLELPR